MVGTLEKGEEIRVVTTIAGAKRYEEFRASIEKLLKAQ
jgi:hypothetical protein